MPASDMSAKEGAAGLELGAAWGIVDTIRHRLVFVDNEHVIRHLNKAAERHFYGERGMGNLVGRSLFECHGKSESRGKIVEIYNRLLAGEDEVLERVNEKGEKVMVVAVRGKDRTLLGYYERAERGE